MIDLIEEFRDYLVIEKTALDEELSHQAELLFKISDEYALATALRDELKEKLAVVDAELDDEVRRDIEIAGDKVTEGMVKANIHTSKKHQQAYDAYARAKKRADRLLALKESFKDRGFMIRSLCDLFVSNYFEANSVRGNDRTDTAVYKQRRAKLAELREKMKK